MRALIPSSLLALLSCAAFGQAFDVASVKISQQQVGRDYEGAISIGRAGIVGRNVTLKSLIAEAYRLQPHRVLGGPGWFDYDQYDVEAKAAGPASADQLLLMLRALLAERFRLALHRETKELQVYQLVADKKGPEIRPSKEGMSMRQLANLISIQLTIPPLGDDSSKPSIGSGPLIPVLDKAGLEGTYDIQVELKPEPGVDSFTLWQRFLQDRLGLKLDSRKEQMEVLVIDSAAKTPTSN
jgi:uncharacterized protein (TIGR03435 family)